MPNTGASQSPFHTLQLWAKEQKVSLVSVSKYASIPQIEQLISQGAVILGESKVQDAIPKIQYFADKALEWHLLGHLQRNKAKKAVQLFHMIQSIDSERIATTINKEAEKIGKKQRSLLQINFAQDPNRYGFSPQELPQFLVKLIEFPNLNIEGILCMGPHTDKETILDSFFNDVRQYLKPLQTRYPQLKTLSMGMSQDYKLAVAKGATMIRIGSLLFKK